MQRAGRMILATLVLAGGLVGCSDARLTLDNYERLAVGMTRDDVESILGEPTECAGAVMLDNCRWGEGQRFIQAQFVGGKAMAYQYQGLN